MRRTTEYCRHYRSREAPWNELMPIRMVGRARGMYADVSRGEKYSIMVMCYERFTDGSMAYRSWPKRCKQSDSCPPSRRCVVC